MGKKLDAILGRSFRTSKVITLANLAISRIAILKKHRQARCSHAKSDVIQLLNLGYQERALLRVEHVIKDQDMMDAFAMIEEYCYLLTERVILLKANKECPEELKEAISSLIFASSRCGEFPELQEIRGLITLRFGKEFTARALELKSNCRVNPKIIQKLSAKQPSLPCKLKVLKEMAAENGVTLQEEDIPRVSEEKLHDSLKQQEESNKPADEVDNVDPRGETKVVHEEIYLEERSESVRARKKYRDVAAAAQEAFESAAYAAAAARAAVKLSRIESQDNDHDGHGGSSHKKETMYDSDGSGQMEPSNGELIFDHIYSVDSGSSKAEDEDLIENRIMAGTKELERTEKKPYTSSSDQSISSGINLLNLFSHHEMTGKQMAIYGTDKSTERDELYEDETQHPNESLKWISQKSHTDHTRLNPKDAELGSTHSHGNRKHLSARTRRA